MLGSDEFALCCQVVPFVMLTLALLLNIFSVYVNNYVNHPVDDAFFSSVVVVVMMFWFYSHR